MILARFHLVDNERCLFCSEHLEEDAGHMLVTCPAKWPLWEAITKHFFPKNVLPPHFIVNYLATLHPHRHISNHTLAFQVIVTTAWFIWTRHYTLLREHPNGTTQPLWTSLLPKLISTIQFLQPTPSPIME